MKSVFSLSKDGDKVDVIEAKFGSFDVKYFYGTDPRPVVVNVGDLPAAMILVRDFLEDTATEQ